MTIAKYALPQLMAIALIPVGACAKDPQKVVVKGKRDPATVVIKGVRDPSAWFRMSRIEGEFVLDNAVLKTCPRPPQGKKLLARLRGTAAKAPAVDFAQMTLSRPEIDWGDPRAALEYLARVGENDPYNPEVHYLSGLAYARLAEGTGSNNQDLLASARASLSQAAVLEPDAPEISYALFRVELLGAAPTEKDVARAINVWRHGYDVPAFTRMAALAHAWLGEAADAYQAFNTLVRDGRNPESAAWAAT